MQSILLNLFMLAVGIILLVKGAGYFIDGASGLVRRLPRPASFAGLFAAAFGMSLPEASVSISAALGGNPEISLGTVLGSSIFSILLVAGISAFITPLAVHRNTLRFEMPLLAGIVIFVTCAGTLLGRLNTLTVIILWGILAVFFIYLLILTGKENRGRESTTPQPPETAGRSLFCTVIGIAAIILGGNVAAENAARAAEYAGVEGGFIGLTVLAVSAGLPELILCTKAALRKDASMAVGNIAGSSIFSFLFSLGTAGLLTPVTFSRSFLPHGIICTAAVLLLLILCSKNRRLTARHGFLLVLLYCAYAACLVMGQMR